MSNRVYINGKLLPKEQAVVSVFDHGFLYGDGVFEGIRVYHGRVFLLREHVERLYESARAIRLEIPMTPDQMIQAVNETVQANGIQEGYVRLVISRGAGGLGLDIRKTSNPQVIVIADSITLYPAKVYEEGLKLVTASTIRNHSAALSPRIKSLNYLNNILARIEGTDAGILEGITRNAVLNLAREAGIPVQECSMVRHDIFIADECFLTGTAAEIVPVVSLDGRPIGNGKPGPLTHKLLKLFQQLTEKP